MSWWQCSNTVETFLWILVGCGGPVAVFCMVIEKKAHHDAKLGAEKKNEDIEDGPR